MTEPNPVEPGEPVRKPVPPVSKLPFVLLGLMTLLTVAGPFAIVLAIRGGDRPDWPPDRPIEWWTLGGICTLVAVVMVACLTVGRWAGPPRHAAGD